jgi:hypothetical protein
MFFNVLNPGPNAAAPYVQPSTANPVANPNVANFPVGDNPLQVEVVPPYYQPGSGSPAQGAGIPQGVVPGMFGAGNAQ